MSLQPLPSNRAPASPCTKVCVLDAAGYCAGCLRTGTEIARWSSMSAAEQWRLLDELTVRRAQAAGASAMGRD